MSGESESEADGIDSSDDRSWGWSGGDEGSGEGGRMVRPILHLSETIMSSRSSCELSEGRRYRT